MSQKIKTYLKECGEGSHALVAIYKSNNPDDSEDVVRWCSRCGAIVVDVDKDNRTYAGRKTKMIRPNVFYRIF